MLSEFLEWWEEHWCNIAMIALTAFVIVMFTAALGGTIENESNRIDSGVIVDKDMDAGRTYFSSDKSGGHMRSYPPSYSFTIRGEKDGTVVEYTFEVSAEEYDAHKIGEVYHR